MSFGGSIANGIVVISGVCWGWFLGGPYNFLICFLSQSDSSILRPIPGGLDPLFPLIHSDGKLQVQEKSTWLEFE